MATGWLLREGDVLAALEPRRAGWAKAIQGAVVIASPAFVHTMACAHGLDVAWCARLDAGGGECFEVRRMASLAGRRLARPQLSAGAIVAAGPGAFERWRLELGDRLEIRAG